MQAALYKDYGPPEVVHLVEWPTPRPGPAELLVQVTASTVTSADGRLRALAVPRGFGLLSRLALGISGPRQKILGVEFAGVVVEVGAAVSAFRPGDRVFGMDGPHRGCHAEFKCLPATGVVLTIPEGLDDEAAASLPFAGTTALDFLRRAQLRAGERVLVNGASGAVGGTAIQLARHFGAEVTAVCGPASIDEMRALGVCRVIDHTREDVDGCCERFDIVFDAVGNLAPARWHALLRPGGRLLRLVAGLPELLAIPWHQWRTGHRIFAAPARETVTDLKTIAELAASGLLHCRIDRRYPLREIVAAHRHVDGGHKHGAVVVVMPTAHASPGQA